MKDKYPRQDHEIDLSDVAPVAQAVRPTIEIDMIKKMILSFSRGTAPGRSGLRAQHLQDMMRSAHADEVLLHLTALINLLSRGAAIPDIKSFLAGASLVGLFKPDGGLRPIAVGEVIRRLTAKCLCEVAKTDAKEYLDPLQIGVATPLGCEVGSHTVRQWWQRNQGDPDKCIFLADFTNAFNMCHREVFLKEVRKHLPYLSHWAEWCYTERSYLFFDQQLIYSERGVQQGDPLGPLLFSLALHPILKRLAEERNINDEVLDLCFGYLDDVVMTGKRSAVAHAIVLLRDAAQQIGLELNWDKCKVILTSAPNEETRADEFLDDVRIFPPTGFKFLGVPIGPKSFCEALTRKRVEKTTPLLEALGDLMDPQIALLLMRSCASFGKIAFKLRTSPLDSHREALRDFGSALRGYFEAFTSLHPDQLEWTQAKLAIRKGGLGLRDAEIHSSAAFIASWCACQDHCQKLDQDFSVQQGASDLETAIGDFNSVVAEREHLTSASAKTFRQKDLSSKIDTAILLRLRENADLQHRAHYNLLELDSSGSWLAAMPSITLGLAIEPMIFLILLQRRLRMRIFDEEYYCPYCDEVMDCYGDHSLSCACGGDRTKRHNLLRNRAAKICDSAGLRPEVEKPGLLEKRSDEERLDDETLLNGRRPADIFLPAWDLGGSTALDFAITSGLRRDALADTAAHGDWSASDYEEKKRNFLQTEQ